MSRRLRRILLILAVSCVLAAVVVARRSRVDFVAETLARLRAENFPVTFEEIRARYPEVPDELNAYLAITAPLQRIADDGRSANVAYDFLARARLPRGVPPSPEWRAKWIPVLERNQPALAQLKRGLSLPQSWDGAAVNDFAETPPVLTGALLLRAEVELARDRRRPREAVPGLTNLFRLAWVIDGAPNYASMILATFIRSMAFDSLENLLAGQPLSDVELSTLDLAMSATRRNGSLELEHARSLATFEFFARSQQLWNTYLQDPALTVWEKLGRKFYRVALSEHDHRIVLEHKVRLLSISRLPWGEQPWAARREVVWALQRLPPKMGRALAGSTPGYTAGPFFQRLTGAGPLGVAFTTGSMALHFDRDIADRLRLLAARTACAVERWRLVHPDRLPDSLAELVPKFLDRVPVDPIDGQPLRYRKTARGYCIYSIGTNLQDDGGLEASADYYKPHDVTFIVERS